MLRWHVLAGCLVIASATFAQQPIKGIDDLDKLAAITDSTITVRPDTAYWRFFVDTLYRQLPNGNMRPIPVYQADLVAWQNGQRRVNRSSGIMTWREIAQYGRAEIDALNNESQIIRDALAGVISFRDQWRDFIIEQREAR